MATPADTPLNLFKRVNFLARTEDKAVYTVPENVAGIIISALATNLTSIPRTVTVNLSTEGVAGLHAIIQNFEIPPNDAVNLVINKFVITEKDSFIVRASDENAVNITLAVLESINTP